MSSATVKPSPAAYPSSAQPAAAERRARSGALRATTANGISLPGSSMKAARAMEAPSSFGDSPPSPPTLLVTTATAKAHQIPTPYIVPTARQLTVRVRASPVMITRPIAANRPGTIAIASRGITSSASKSRGIATR